MILIKKFIEICLILRVGTNFKSVEKKFLHKSTFISDYFFKLIYFECLRMSPGWTRSKPHSTEVSSKSDRKNKNVIKLENPYLT